MKSKFLYGFRFLAASQLVCFIALCYHGKVYAIDDSMLEKARQYFAQGDTFSGVTEYMRYLFFSSDDMQKHEVCLEVADTFFSNGAFRQAAEWYRRSSDFAPDSSQTYVFLLHIIALMRAGDFAEALFQTTWVDTARCPGPMKRKYYLCKSLLLVKNGQRERALPYLARYTARCSVGTRIIGEWLHDNPRPPEKRKIMAQLLSLVVPGSGLAYVGDYGGAINALLLNCLTGVPAYYAIKNRLWADASLFLWLFSRFYFGGLNVVAEKTDVENKKIRTRYHNEFFTLINGIAKACGSDKR